MFTHTSLHWLDDKMAVVSKGHSGTFNPERVKGYTRGGCFDHGSGVKNIGSPTFFYFFFSVFSGIIANRKYELGDTSVTWWQHFD